MELNKPITTIIIVIITAMLVFLFVIPEYQQSQDLELSLAQKSAQYDSQSAYYQNIASLQNSLTQRKEALDKINSSLPDTFQLAPLTYFFQQKSKETGSTLKSVVFLDSEPQTAATQPATSAPKKVRSISFSIDLIGSYQSLKSFLVALEKSSRIFEVDTVSFASIKDQQGTAPSQNQTYDFKLAVKTYSY